MREYNSETDYQVILESQRKSGEMSIAKASMALKENGVQWPNLNSNDPASTTIDRDLLRCWRELGYHPRG